MPPISQQCWGLKKPSLFQDGFKCSGGKDVRSAVYYMGRSCSDAELIRKIIILIIHYWNNLSINFMLLSIWLFILSIKRCLIMRITRVDGKCNICGSRLREIRKTCKLSQEQVAAKLQLMGLNIDQKAVSRMETGQRVIMDYELRYLAEVFSVSLLEFFRTETDSSPCAPAIARNARSS